MKAILLLSLIQLAFSQVSSPKNWLVLNFSSEFPVDELRLKEPPLNLYHRDDLEGIHTIAMDEIPKSWVLEVSNEIDNTSLTLFPTRDLKMAEFNISHQAYDVSYRITCKMGFYGNNCDKMCLPGDHFNCSLEGEKICHEGWTGGQCDKEINVCSSDPCQHGVCLVESSTQFQCVCVPGYEGSFCQTKSPPTNGWTTFEAVVITICFLLTFGFLGIFFYFFIIKRAKREESPSTVLPTYVLYPSQLKNLKEEVVIVIPELLV